MVEYWLDILKQNSQSIISASYTQVLTYNGHDFFFVSGEITEARYNINKGGGYTDSHQASILIAVGKPAVQVLTDQDHLFRRICGTEELAAFSICRWSEFTEALIRKGH